MDNNSQLTPSTKLEGEIKRGKINGGLQANHVHSIDNTSDVGILRDSDERRTK